MAFATEDDLKAYLQQEAFNQIQHTAALLVLDLATDEIREFTDQTLTLADSDVELRGSWKRLLWLPEIPVVSVASVTVDGVALGGDDWRLLPGGRLKRLNCGHWEGPEATVAVSYEHGWPDDELPSGLRGRCLRIAARAFDSAVDAVTSETIGSYSVSYGRRDAGVYLDKSDERALRRLRRICA